MSPAAPCIRAVLLLLLCVDKLSGYHLPCASSGRRLRQRLVCASEDEGWLQAKLKIAVAQEDYATAARIKGLIDTVTASAPLEMLPPPLVADPPALPGSPRATSGSFKQLRNGPTVIISASAAANGGAAVSAALEADGLVRVDAAITPRVASELLRYVDNALEEALRETSEHEQFDDEWQNRFGNVLSRACRHDVKLGLQSPPVRAALASLLTTLQPAICRCLGENAELYELAALISLPGAARQPVHPDTPITAGKGTDVGATILTAFCALQDIDETMGPTLFLPATHTAEAHASFFTYENFDLAFHSTDDDEEEEEGGKHEWKTAALLESWDTWRATLSTGDVSLFDSRCLHSGGANTSPTPRALFYCSFIKADYSSACDGTLLESLRGKYTLKDWREWVTAPMPPKGPA